jgi:hypothetical protein
MVPESWGMLAVVIPFRIETLFECIVGEDSGLGKAIHYHLDFNIHPSLVVDEFVEIVMLDIFAGD